jgi:hypothetical protein
MESSTMKLAGAMEEVLDSEVAPDSEEALDSKVVPDSEVVPDSVESKEAVTPRC